MGRIQKPTVNDRVFGGKLFIYGRDAGHVCSTNQESGVSRMAESLKPFGAHWLYFARKCQSESRRNPIVPRFGFKSVTTAGRNSVPFVFSAESYSIAIKHRFASAAMMTNGDPIVIIRFPSGSMAMVRCGDDALNRECVYRIRTREIVYKGIISGAISSVTHGPCRDVRLLVMLADDRQHWNIMQKCQWYRIPPKNIYRAYPAGHKKLWSPEESGQNLVVVKC